MEKLLKEKGYTLTEKERIKYIKEKFCYIALDLNKRDDVNYELPDGNVIMLSSERYKCTVQNMDGIHKFLYDSGMMFEIDINQKLFGNIVIGGGNTMFKDIDKRY